MHDYTFDIKLAATLRIQAVSRRRAESAIEHAIELAEGFLRSRTSLQEASVSDASLYVDDVCGPLLIERDGVEID